MSDMHSNALVLIVDDDVFERLGASYMFSDAGYRVFEAGSADDALQFLESTADVRLLFTDVSMPGSMSGSDLARRVAERWPEIGIIITSAGHDLSRSIGLQFHAKPMSRPTCSKMPVDGGGSACDGRQMPWARRRWASPRDSGSSPEWHPARQEENYLMSGTPELMRARRSLSRGAVRSSIVPLLRIACKHFTNPESGARAAVFSLI
jgi:CheY-like chemotaxis protein